MRKLIHLTTPIILAFFLFSLQAVYAQVVDTQADRKLKEWTAALTKIELTLKRIDLNDEQVGKLRDQISIVQNSARDLLIKLEPELLTLKQENKGLGAPPANMPEAIAKARADQKARLDKQQSLVDGTKLAQSRADNLDRTASNLQHTRFVNRLLDRAGTPLNPSMWTSALPHLADIPGRMRFLIAGWTGDKASRPGNGRYAILLLSILAAFLISFPLRSRILAWIRPRSGPDKLHITHRVQVAAGSAFIDTALPMIALLLVYAAMRLTGSLTLRIDNLVAILIGALVWTVAIRSVARAVLAPNNQRWRLVNLNETSALASYRLIASIAYVFGFDQVFSGIASLLFLPVNLTIAMSVASSLVIAALIVALLRTRFTIAGVALDDDYSYFTWLRLIIKPLWLIVLIVIAATLFGYIALGHFLAIQIVQTGLLIATLYLIHVLCDELLLAKLGPDQRAEKLADQPTSLVQHTIARYGPALSAIIDFILVLVALPLLLLQWGLSGEDLRRWTEAAFFGVEFGNVRISLSSILIALGVLITGFVITRLVQKWLDVRLLGKTGLDIGVRNSIRTGLGYIGIIMTIIIAVSYAGMRFTDIAIVAGALSVGIGFGLQGIVNNFVSGLILLAERPFKAGDWIAIGNEEGYVKQINVRSTEVTTFDRATLTVPNSELITKTVMNWTHKGTLGRVIVGVGVAYDTDPEQVRDLLLACAAEHKEVKKTPPPSVVFKNFGDSALEFELRAFIVNVDKRLSIGSDLRFAIFDSLKKAGIEIPFPQRDIHIKQTGPAG